jgi:hypothetical protein
MPGQAPTQQMPGLMPQQGAPTPQAMTGSLKNMPLEQLKMFYQNPQPGSPPLWAVISALAEKQKEAQAMMNAQGQSAMAQNAQMRQQPPVAAQVVQAAQQMAEPQAYAGGGAVAFQDAGLVGLQNPEYDEEGLPRTNAERERIDRNNRIFLQQQRNVEAQKQLQAQKASVRETSSAVPQQQLDFYRSTGRDRPVTLGMPESSAASPASKYAPTRLQDTRGGTPEMAQLAQMLGAGQTASPAPGAASAGAQRRQTVAAAPTAPAAPQSATPADLPPTLLAAMKEREDQLHGRLTRPESLTRAEEGIAALAKSNIEAQQAETKTYGEEIRAARDAALARAQRDILNDPQSLLALAGSIDTRKGQGISSLARGASGLLSEREKQAEAARKEYALAQRDERAMQANIRQTQMLEAQRQLALEQGRMKDVNDINDQLSRLSIERENFRITRGDKAFEQAMEGRKVTAEERKARAAEISAGKPDATVQLLQTLFPGQAPSVENLAKIAAAQYGPKLGAKEMTYDQASDNVKNFLDSTAGITEVNAIKKRAKDAGQPEPSILDIRETLIDRELRRAAARSGTSAATPTGKIMTMADVQATATSSGKTVDEVKKAAIAAGYTIQ